LAQWPGDEQLDGHSLDVTFTDSLFLGEWPTGAVYKANCVPDFRPEKWDDALGTDAVGLGVATAVMTERYCWEGGIYDCSLPQTLIVHILTGAAAALFPGIRHVDGAGVTPDGRLIHIDPNAAPGGDGALLADEELLAQAMDQAGLVLVQVIRQTKYAIFPESDRRFGGQITQTRLVTSVGDTQLCDLTRYETIAPRMGVAADDE
jgi:hypothetical protein